MPRKNNTKHLVHKSAYKVPLSSDFSENLETARKNILDETVFLKEAHAFNEIVFDLLLSAYQQKDLEQLQFIYQNLPESTKSDFKNFYLESSLILETLNHLNETLETQGILQARKKFFSLHPEMRALLEEDFRNKIAEKLENNQAKWNSLEAKANNILSGLKKTHKQEFFAKNKPFDVELHGMDEKTEKKILFEAKQFRNRILNGF